MKRKVGFMPLEDFKTIIDENKQLFRNIDLHFQGEPLLHPKIMEMVKYATEKGIKTLVSTNCTFLDKYIDEILDSGLTDIIVCLDGASKASHEEYRVGSDFEQVKENIRKLCQAKRKRNLDKPRVILQFIVMKTNEHEIGDIIELGRELGVNDVDLKTAFLSDWGDSERIIQAAKDFLPNNKRYNRFVWREGKPKIRSKRRICGWIRRSAILWNGDVILCCYDYNGELVVGNIFRDGGFQNIWKSERYKKFRKKVVRREFDLCKNCDMTTEYRTRIHLG